ncbi:glycosyltransferase family 4 protein [Winogradskyella maritima]|uniref:Glycosyltransferase family 4 protein n=1 Tax=Winogradskyella maritima TaxID=1517766 RepID=A0ABV8AGN4_9FLAO|nr:glycosyltransferase family 4 protein [Winogradskyella maritima]
MKQLLIFTNYFPPEMGAASNRIHHLAEGLKDEYEVSVVTPLPNYPTGKIFEGYKGKWRYTSTEDEVTVNRLWVYASNSKNKFKRLLAMLSYSFSICWFILTRKVPNKVIVQSPPLLVAFTCMLFLKSKKRKLVLNVSDLWPLAGLELNALKKGFGYSVLEKIERFNYKRSDLILGQSEEILSHVKTIVPNTSTFLYRNFPDFEPPELASRDKSNTGKIKMVYAGLLGIAQGVLKLCKALDYSNVEFHIYGSGAEAELILEYISNNPNLLIYYHGSLKREELHKALLQYDLTIIPLVNRIYGSVPSKVFEYARLGLPMLYFGGGEGESIVLQNDLGWVVTSGDYEALNTCLGKLKISELDIMRNAIQTTALKAFNFKSQITALKRKL